jgi:nucleotide-binding universal stress UspA family protein
MTTHVLGSHAEREMFNDVIVGVGDYEAGRDALALAKELAARERPLTLAYVEVLMHRPDPDSGAVWQEADRRRALELLASLRDEFRVDAEPLCVEARSVAQGLRALVAGEDADLLVIGASRRDEYERVYVGDDTRDMLKDPPCPVAVAPLGYATRRPVSGKIGVAYDGSPEGEQALVMARDLARERGTGLSAFQAVPMPLSSHDPWNSRQELAEDVEEARERIVRLGGVEAHAASGDAVEGLAQYGASVDLLVVGSHKHGLIDELMSGSTAQRLADNAPCPLLVLA